MALVDVQGDDSSSSSAEIPVLPIYEVELDLENVDGRTKRAEIEGGVQLRCTVKGRADERDPQLGWNYDGSVLTTTKEGIQVETDNLRLVSNLKLSKEQAAKGGTYECTAKSKADGRFYTSKLKLVPKRASSNETLFGEVLCGSDRDGWCQHDGTCLFQQSTRIYSCRCANGYSGPNCEYHPSELHIISSRTSAPILITPPAITADAEHYKKSTILTGSAAGILIVSLILALLLYIKKRYFRDQIKSRFSRVSFRRKPNHHEDVENGGSKYITEIDEERLIDQHHPIRTKVSIAGRSIDITSDRSDQQREMLLNERLRVIKSLIPAKCPYCKHGLIVDGLSAIENGGKASYSSPQLSSNSRRSMISDNRSIIDSMITMSKKRERRGGVSGDDDDDQQQIAISGNRTDQQKSIATYNP